GPRTRGAPSSRASVQAPSPRGTQAVRRAPCAYAILDRVPQGDDRYELAVLSAKGTAIFPVERGRQLVIGRGEEADIVIDDVAISRKHAVVHGGPPLEIEDLGSANGTFMTPGARGGRKEETADNRRTRVTRSELAGGYTILFGAAMVIVRKKEARAAKSAADAVVRAPSMVRLYEEAARAAKSTLPILVL